MSLTSENGEKLNFESNFGLFSPNLGLKGFLWVCLVIDVRHCCELSLYATSRKTYDPNSRK